MHMVESVRLKGHRKQQKGHTSASVGPATCGRREQARQRRNRITDTQIFNIRVASVEKFSVLLIGSIQ